MVAVFLPHNVFLGFFGVLKVDEGLSLDESTTCTATSLISFKSIIPQGSCRIEVLSSSNFSGWVYFRFEDVGRVFTETKRSINFTKAIGVGVTQLPPENAWVAGEAQTSPDDSDPFFLHIIDYLEEAGEGVYLLHPCVSDYATDEQEFEPVVPPGKFIV